MITVALMIAGFRCVKIFEFKQVS